MLPKQDNYKVGIYLRLSKDDERQGESLSIENQRRVLTNYVNEQAGLSMTSMSMTEFRACPLTALGSRECSMMQRQAGSILSSARI